MPGIKTEKNGTVNLDDLLSTLQTPALRSLSSKVDQLLALRQAATQEADLLEKIKSLIPASVVRRYRQLSTRQQKGQLTDQEHREILFLTDFMEEKSAERVLLLDTLAKLRNVPLRALTQQLRIRDFHV